jgi:hypothetical protein
MASTNGGFPAKTSIAAISDPPGAAPDDTPEPVPAAGFLLPAGFPSPAEAAICRLTWLVYRIRRWADGHGYVGVTARPLPTRIAAYDHAARRRLRVGGPGTLVAAIRQAYAEGLSFISAFQVDVLAEAFSPDEARRLERHWIARLGTARPHGFNIMPGGASLGGPANSVPVVLEHPARGTLHYGSLLQAIADIDRERRDQGELPLQLGAVYARCAMGWPVAEALGLTKHADGRRKRPLFRWHGRTYDTLHELALAEGLPIDTIRSKLYRARQAGCDAAEDAASDRRLPGHHRTGGVGCGRQPFLVLPHPLHPQADPVDAATFARLTGLPRATVLHRYHRLAKRKGASALTQSEVVAALTQRTDRRHVITLALPDGRRLSGGVREVINAVLADPNLDELRAKRLGFSAIRARLRRLPCWPGRLSQSELLWAFGFRRDAKPPIAELPTAA